MADKEKEKNFTGGQPPQQQPPTHQMPPTSQPPYPPGGQQGRPQGQEAQQLQAIQRQLDEIKNTLAQILQAQQQHHGS